MQVCPPLELAVGFIDCAQQVGERAVLVNRVEPRKLGSKLGDFPARKKTHRDYAIIVLTLVAPYRHHRSERPPALHVPSVTLPNAWRAAPGGIRETQAVLMETLHRPRCCFLSTPMSQLQLLLRKVLDAVVVMRRDGTVSDWNKCAEATFGWTREEANGRSLNDLIVPLHYREAHSTGLQRYIETGVGPVIDQRIEISAIDKAGREFPVELSITEVEHAGEPVFIGFLRDISERKTAELALKESEARLAATYNHALVGIAEVDREGRFLRTNDQFCRITGYSGAELAALSLFEITHPDDVANDRARFDRLWSGEIDDYMIEKRYVRKDGRTICIELAASIVRGGNGASSYGVRIVRDVSDRKQAEEHQRLLLNELNHRVKNTLAVVQGVAHQTFRGEQVPAELTTSFQARLAALAAAHDLLIRRQWAPTPVKQVIDEALRPFDGPQGQFSIAGDELLLPPQSAVTLALAVHELATNAAKHGALSTAQGRVRVQWKVNGDSLTLVWEESGGPPVTQPGRRGFGTRLLQQALARELRGTVDIDFRTEGVRCTVIAPVPPI